LLLPHLAILGRKAPSLLQVCKESRALLLPTYTTSLNDTRTLFPLPYQSGNWHHVNPRSHALSNMFFPCQHEADVANKKSTMYWDLENDIFSLHMEQWKLDQEGFLSETAFLWSGHGWSGPKIYGIRNVALEFKFFSDWCRELSPADPFYDEGRVVYVILNRRSIDGDEGWERHFTRFMCWYHQRQIYYPQAEGRKHGWELKIVGRCDGYLSDRDFDEAVSEHDVGGWKDDPHFGSWRADEESWRD
jgi:hypothetical protein